LSGFWLTVLVPYRPLEDAGVVTPETGKIWYEDLVGGIEPLSEEELPEGALTGLNFKSTFTINTQVYLQW